MRRTSLRRLANPCVLALLLACAGEAGDEAPPPSSPAAQPASTRASSRISVERGRVWLSVRGAPRSEILGELAVQARFELIAGTLPAARLTLAVEDAPLEAVLAQLLEGIDYRVDYRFDAGAGAHVVARVVAGEPGRSAPAGPSLPRRASDAEAASPAVVAEAPARGSLRNALRRWEDASGEDPAERRRRRQQRAAEQARILEQLYSDSASERTLAVESVDIDGPGRDRLYEMVEADPDPGVRAAAVERLMGEDSLAALDSLYAALEDPASMVVLAAIETLEVVGDERALPYLEPLVEGHPDPDVRQAAYEALEFLE